jgi:hypothetical protein
MSKALMPITGIGLDEFILPSSIAAMEIYPSGAATPLEFRAANGCGAIVIWTKVRTRISPADSGTSRAPAADTSGVH